jgi:hypothetical protein
MALSRTCNLTDFPDVETVADWQQALALRAYAEWAARRPPEVQRAICVNWSEVPFLPPGPDATVYDVRMHLPSSKSPLAVVWALSVLDRIEAPALFIKTYADRLVEGGLFFATFAAWDAEGEDVAMGHRVRHRIYDAHSLRKLLTEACKAATLLPFGPIDWSYHGHALGDHTLASLVLIKSIRTPRAARNGDTP